MTVTQGPRLAPASARAQPLADEWEDSGHRVDTVIAPAPHPRPGRTPLRVLPTEHLERRARRRRARLTLTVAASLVAASLLGVVAINVMIAQDQLRLDRVDAQRNAALAQRGQLQLQVAQLQSPARIVAQAEQRLGMVVPSKLTFLSGNGAPVQTTGSGAIPPPLAPPSPPATSPASPPAGATPPGASSTPPGHVGAGAASPPTTTPATVSGSSHR